VSANIRFAATFRVNPFIQDHTMRNANSISINADIRGGTRRLTLWPYGEQVSGALKELHQSAQRAARLVGIYDRKRFDIEYDDRLSDGAKRQDTQKAALDQLASLTAAHKNLRSLAEEIDERRNALLEVKPYAPSDFATVAIDLALAQHLRTMTEAERLKAAVADPRVAEVIARLPTTLTGISEGVKGRLLTDAAVQKNPAEAKELETLSEAMRYVSEGFTNAAITIARDAGLDQSQFAPYAHIGSGEGSAPESSQTPEPAATQADAVEEPAE
jgi:hypothetical protein